MVPLTKIIAYADERGLDGRAKYFLMGGLLGSPPDWKYVSSQWQQIVDRFGVPEFHSNHFFGGKEPYHSWDGSQRDSLLDSLLSVLCNSRIAPVGCAIHSEDFMRLSIEERRILSGAYVKTRLTLRRPITTLPFETKIRRSLESPDAEKQVYRAGFRFFLGAVAFKAPPHCSIMIVLDRNEELSPGALEYFQKRRKGHKYPRGQTLESLTFVNSTNEPAIQAADLYTHVAARKLNGYSMDPRRKRAWEALCKENSPHLMNYRDLRRLLDPIEQWNRQFNIDWGFPPEHESAF